MGKTVLIVLACSAFIILGFLGSLYLMTTINPDPLSDTRLFQGVEPVQSHESDPAQLMQAAPYDLVKMDGDVTDFYPSKVPGSYPNSGRKVVPPIWPRRNQEIITPTIHKVMPPIWPTASVPSDTDLTRSIKPDHYEISTSKEILSSNKLDIKSRKSRSNYRSDDDVESITSNILNNTGKPRIEIKFHPKKRFLQKKKAKGNKHAKSKSVLIGKPENNNDVDKNPLIANHTVINICGNDSIVIDESGNLDIHKLIELIKLFTSDEMKYNITDITKENMTTKPLSKNASDDMFVYNKVESYNYRTENNSNINFNISNVNDIHDRITIEPMKGDIHDVIVTNLDSINITEVITGVKNSSEIDTQMNNKEFNKIEFDDEVIDGITQKTSNITDLYIENDSDIIF